MLLLNAPQSNRTVHSKLAGNSKGQQTYRREIVTKKHFHSLMHLKVGLIELVKKIFCLVEQSNRPFVFRNPGFQCSLRLAVGHKITDRNTKGRLLCSTMTLRSPVTSMKTIIRWILMPSMWLDMSPNITSVSFWKPGCPLRIRTLGNDHIALP